MVKANVLEYKGYQGSIETSIEDECIHGKILHISDLVTYEASTIAELKAEFKAAVDDYIDTCKAIGKSPEKSFNGVFNVRVPPALHRALTMKATSAGVPLNNYITSTLEKAVAREQKEIPANPITNKMSNTPRSEERYSYVPLFTDAMSLNSSVDPALRGMVERRSRALKTNAVTQH